MSLLSFHVPVEGVRMYGLDQLVVEQVLCKWFQAQQRLEDSVHVAGVAKISKPVCVCVCVCV